MKNTAGRTVVKIGRRSYSVPADAAVVLRHEFNHWSSPIALAAEDPVEGMPGTLIAPEKSSPTAEGSRFPALVAEIMARFPGIPAGEAARVVVGNPLAASRLDSSSIASITSSAGCHEARIGNPMHVYGPMSEQDAPEGWPLVDLGESDE
ncbi:hypothetical protein DXC81_08210 [Collinsella tanakaei]|uniref:Uncharacterized protein n=1 Tax=Collinsella tanakaei TaxID=626935 RepID=A0A3E4QQU5_9ACTN|nr:hypothetical protein [Collinsella tanakaei]RGL09566.1 hypothetical protein DXC81_08210 [Collinsella tanakaei]